jgi:hypothetical protein
MEDIIKTSEAVTMTEPRLPKVSLSAWMRLSASERNEALRQANRGCDPCQASGIVQSYEKGREGCPFRSSETHRSSQVPASREVKWIRQMAIVSTVESCCFKVGMTLRRASAAAKLACVFEM